MSIKKIQPFFSSTGRLLLCLVLGVLTAWLLREEITSLLMGGKEFAGRSLPVQASLLLGLALAAAVLWAVLLYFYGGALAGFLKGIPGWVGAHPEITLILVLSFIARFFLADWNSYWYDELVSVKLLGIDQDSALDVVRSMVTGDRHPPLYQVVLFYWMRVFGNSELATRMLSTLFITLAALMLYLLAYDLYGKRVAIAAALFLISPTLPCITRWSHATLPRQYSSAPFRLMCCTGTCKVPVVIFRGKICSSTAGFFPPFWSTWPSC